MTTSSKRPNDYFDLPAEAKADDQYVVEKIVAKRRTRKGKWEYLLKWAGCKFPSSSYFMIYFQTIHRMRLFQLPVYVTFLL
jgi:hypothetical protein